MLFALSGIEREVVAAAEPLELLPALTTSVARIGHLIALKVLSREDIERPKMSPTCGHSSMSQRLSN